MYLSAYTGNSFFRDSYSEGVSDTFLYRPYISLSESISVFISVSFSISISGGHFSDRAWTFGRHLSAVCPPEIELEKKIELEIEREKEQGKTAHAYGRYQNVILSDEELSELQSELSTSWSYYVEKLSEYMASTGRQYQSHAATIRRWAAEDMRRQSSQRDYSVKAGDTI